MGVMRLEGLNCPNCAEKILRRIEELDGVEAADFSLMSQKLTLETKRSLQDYRERIQRICDEIEPGVLVRLDEERSVSNSKSVIDHVKALAPLLAGVLVFLFLHLLGEKIGLSSKVVFGLEILLVLIVGRDVYLTAAKNLAKGLLFDEHFLMSVATIGAIVVGDAPEALAVLVFFEVGEYLEDCAVERSRKNMEHLWAMKPTVAHKREGENLVDVSPESLVLGDVVLVRPGESIPCDGTVLSGSSYVDTSSMTGESTPVFVGEGDDIFSGTMNGEGLLEVRIGCTYEESSMAKLMTLLEEAEGKKAKIEGIITRFSRIYTPVVVALAVATGLFSYGILHLEAKEALYRACIFLIVSCPCALMISVPLGIVAGLGAASRMGAFIKGGSYLEALAEVDTLFMDKTGTVTEGNFGVKTIEAKGLSREKLLAIAAAGEEGSNHPIGRAIVDAFSLTGLEKERVEEVQEISGHGLRFLWETKAVLLGKKSFLEEEGVSGIEGEEGIFMAMDGAYCGRIVVEDEIKCDAVSAMNELKRMGIDLVLLSGDSPAIVSQVGDTLGVTKALGGLLPWQKVEAVEGAMGKRKVAFVGDGINDAPVIARADVGLSMGGTGADVAVESSDVVLLASRMETLPRLFALARKTRVILWQNIAIALGVKVLVIILGSLGLANMWEAVFADVGVTMLCIGNAMRLFGKNKRMSTCSHDHGSHHRLEGMEVKSPAHGEHQHGKCSGHDHDHRDGCCNHHDHHNHAGHEGHGDHYHDSCNC